MEIADLVKKLKQKLKKKHPDKSDRRIEREISDQLGEDFTHLFEKERNQKEKSPTTPKRQFDVSSTRLPGI